MGVGLSAFNTVRKSNVLNEVRNSDITTAEYRLFCIYLAHFKMKEPGNNTVTFNLSDYARIVNLDRPRKPDIEKQAQNILSRSVQVDNADGGFTRYALFDTFKLHKEDDAWLVTLECGHKIAPLIREERGRFIRYKLYNTIFLKSYNQQRIYELLKQYERIGERTITLEDLREYLSIGKNEYPKWAIFARDVLKVAQNALEENTDIAFDYVPIKKGKPVVAVKFIIRKNENYKDKLQLEGFLPAQPNGIEYEDGEITIYADEQAAALDDVDSANVVDDTEQIGMFDNETTEFEACLINELPEEVYGGKIERVRAINDIARRYITADFMKFLSKDEAEKVDLDKLAAATRQANDDCNDRILNAVRTFTVQEYNVRRNDVKTSPFAYFKAAFNGWLQNQNHTL